PAAARERRSIHRVLYRPRPGLLDPTTGRTMRRVLKVLAFAILGLAALIVLALGFFATPPGHGVLAGMIERAASTNGLTVKVEGLGGTPPFSLTARKITVADADGIFAEVDDLA